MDYSTIALYATSIVAGLSIFIEITPIKFNPLTFIWKKLSLSFNAPIIDRMNDLDNKLDNHIKQYEEDKILDARRRIIAASNDILLGINKTEESFNNLIADIDMYNYYCETHPGFKNSLAVFAISVIENEYRSKKENDSFL